MRNCRGLTLVEMMVALAILGVLSGAIFTSLAQSREVFRAGDLQVYLQEETRAGMDEFLEDIRESDPATVTVYSYTDPLDGLRHEAIAFASARGDPLDAGDGDCIGLMRNDCFHTNSGNALWRSLVVYTFYQTGAANGSLKQLRRYVDYDAFDYTTGVFPFTFQSITATQINLRSATGTNFSLTRGPDFPSTGRPRVVVADNLEHEDQDNDGSLDGNENDGSQSLPDDDMDGQLDYGARFTVNGRVVALSLFLRENQSRASNASEALVVGLDGSCELRN